MEGHSHIWFWLALIVTNIFWLTLVLYFAKEYIKQIVFRSKRLEMKFVRRDEHSNSSDISIFEDKLQQLERRLGELQEKFNKIADDKQKEPEKQEPVSTPPPVEKPKDTSEQFFKTKSRKVFYQETDADASFRVFNIKGNNAEFEYCGGVVSPDFLTDVCDFLNNPWKLGNIKKIATKTAGKVSKNYDGNWEVMIPAKIEFL